MATRQPQTTSKTAAYGSGIVLARTAAGSFALNIVNTVAAVLTTMLLARAMAVADFGLYSWVVALVALLAIPAVLGVDRLVVRDIAVYVSQDAFGHARGLLLRAAQLVVATSVVLALATVLIASLVSFGASKEEALAVGIGVSALLFLALGRVIQAALAGLHHVVLGQLPEFVLRPLLFLLLILGVLIVLGPPLDASLVLLIYVLSLVVGALIGARLLQVKLPPSMLAVRARFETRAWVMGAAALAFLSAAMVVNLQAGVLLVGALDGAEAAGIYAVSQRAAWLISFPLSAVNAALAPTAASMWASGDVDRLQRLVTLSARGVLLLSLPLAVAYVLFGDVMLALLFGTPFTAGASILAILTVGQLANVLAGSVGTLLVMTGNQRRAALGITMGALTNVALAVVLIPRLGPMGAAIAEAVSAVVSNVLLAIVVWRLLGLNTTALPGRPRRLTAD